MRNNGFFVFATCCLLVFSATSCQKIKGIFGKKKSSTTGWTYNDSKNGGIEYNNVKAQKTGPGLVFIPGGTSAGTSGNTRSSDRENPPFVRASKKAAKPSQAPVCGTGRLQIESMIRAREHVRSAAQTAEGARFRKRRANSPATVPPPDYKVGGPGQSLSAGIAM